MCYIALSDLIAIVTELSPTLFHLDRGNVPFVTIDHGLRRKRAIQRLFEMLDHPAMSFPSACADVELTIRRSA